MSKFVKYEDLKKTRIITFDRPEKKNAFNEEMLVKMSEIIQDTEKINQIRNDGQISMNYPQRSVDVVKKMMMVVVVFNLFAIS